MHMFSEKTNGRANSEVIMVFDADLKWMSRRKEGDIRFSVDAADGRTYCITLTQHEIEKLRTFSFDGVKA